MVASSAAEGSDLSVASTADTFARSHGPTCVWTYEIAAQFHYVRESLVICTCFSSDQAE